MTLKLFGQRIDKMVKVTTLPNGRKKFYVDLGNMPVDQAVEYVNQVRKQFAKQGKN